MLDFLPHTNSPFLVSLQGQQYAIFGLHYAIKWGKLSLQIFLLITIHGLPSKVHRIVILKVNISEENK